MAAVDPSASTSLPTSTTTLPSDTDSLLHPPTINIGTRKSHLARVQTDMVVDMLKKTWPGTSYNVHAISTMGDKNQVTALHDFGAKSLWTHELEAMLAAGEVDFIVHCLKDIPTQLPTGMTIGAILEREDPRDAVVLHPSLPPGTTLSSLPANATIGTSSVRRSAQLKRLYPHLRFQSVRGNLGTRLGKLDKSDLQKSTTVGIGSKIGDATTVDETADAHFHAIILAAAGLLRVGEGKRIARCLSSRNAEEVQPGQTAQKGILYAVGQGALALEVREGDQRVLDLIKPLAHRHTALATLAERSLMRTLEGGCSVPIGVETEWAGADAVGGAAATDSEKLVMRAIVVSLDGMQHIETSMERAVQSEADSETFGRDVAAKLIEQGAEDILKKINLDRAIIEKQGDA